MTIRNMDYNKKIKMYQRKQECKDSLNTIKTKVSSVLSKTIESSKDTLEAVQEKLDDCPRRIFREGIYSGSIQAVKQLIVKRGSYGKYELQIERTIEPIDVFEEESDKMSVRDLVVSMNKEFDDFITPSYVTAIFFVLATYFEEEEGLEVTDNGNILTIRVIPTTVEEAENVDTEDDGVKTYEETITN